MSELSKQEKEVQEYLARIRKTIADSESLVAQAELRIAETDRMLERQGLTREQVMAMHFTEAQMDAVNAELQRRGLDPLEEWGGGGDASPGAEPTGRGDVFPLDGQIPGGSGDVELENRQRKFGMMMKPFQI